VPFDDSHVQRAGLLLLNNVVYVAFGPLPETKNGWLFGYTLSGGLLSQTAIFNSTPHGTGGGIWQAGAAPASDGVSIYLRKQLIHDGPQHIVLTTAQLPSRAGIDPLHKLISRLTAENTIGVQNRTKRKPAPRSK